MAGITGGFYCIEDLAEHLVARIESEFESDRSIHGDPVPKTVRRENATIIVAKELRDILEQRVQ